MKQKILFVCLGNICRSPSAEAVMNAYIYKNNLQEYLICDSAGTAAYHSGERADSRMRKHANKRGYNLTSIARKFNPAIDFDKFDFILAMDKQNFSDLQQMARNNNHKQKIMMMTDYCRTYSNYDAVPDPYYGGADGFELVLDILEDACETFLHELIKHHKL